MSDAFGFHTDNRKFSEVSDAELFKLWKDGSERQSTKSKAEIEKRFKDISMAKFTDQKITETLAIKELPKNYRDALIAEQSLRSNQSGKQEAARQTLLAAIDQPGRRQTMLTGYTK